MAMYQRKLDQQLRTVDRASFVQRAIHSNKGRKKDAQLIQEIQKRKA